ncbi:MAG: hypothetical protein COA63_009995 [Methylophaga sp.]|nr:hypothetical protein [Methylophaga sp.]
MSLYNHPLSLLVLSFAQVLLIAGLLYIRFTDNFAGFYNTIFIITVICSSLLFNFGFTIFKKLSLVLKSHSKATGTIVFYQLYLHIIIIAFLLFDHIYGRNYTAIIVLYPFLIAFFMTARITWRACFVALGSKIYKVFAAGSTALLIWSIVLTLLGLFYQQRFLSENLYTIVLVYFALHFAELGFVLLKIRKDLNVSQT